MPVANLGVHKSSIVPMNGIQPHGNAPRTAGRDVLPEGLSPHALGRISGHVALTAGKNLRHTQSIRNRHDVQYVFRTFACAITEDSFA